LVHANEKNLKHATFDLNPLVSDTGSQIPAIVKAGLEYTDEKNLDFWRGFKRKLQSPHSIH
jgi:hypothetical protein